MKSKRLYTFIFFLILIARGYGQQDPQFSQFMYTILPINPGIAGTAGICASLHYRQQWAGFYDEDTLGHKYKVSPRDIMLTLHTPLKKSHSSLGLTVYNDSYGQQSDITVKLAYSYRMNVFGGVLGAGISADLLSRKVYTDRFWGGGWSTDPTILANMGKSDMYVDMSFGVYYLMQNKWYAGISGTNLIAAIGGDKINQKASRHFYVIGGYEYVIPANPNWTLKPQALLKTDLKVVPQIDVVLIADWVDMIWFGASYRAIDAVVLLAGAKPFANYTNPLRGLEVAVSYDITTSKLGREGRSFGGFEFGIKYCFKIVPPIRIEWYKGTRLLGNRPIEYR